MSDIVLRITEQENQQKIQQWLHDYCEESNNEEWLHRKVEELTKDYVAIDSMDDLQPGRYVRWIREGILVKGGVVLSVDEERQSVFCKTLNHIFTTFLFEDCPCFMKLNQFEAWYLHNGTVLMGPPSTV
jgi:hypothetical protein